MPIPAILPLLYAPAVQHFHQAASPLANGSVTKASLEAAEAPVDVGWSELGPAILFTMLAAVVVALRWYTRAWLTRRTAWEDWMVGGSLVLSIAMTAVIGAEAHIGLNWEDYRGEKGAVKTMAKLVLANNILYQILINTTKASIIIQYLRLFSQKLMCYACFLILSALVGAAGWGVFGGILLCDPVHKYWDPRTQGSCMDAETYWVSTAGAGIILDIIIWLLPMPLIGQLRLPVKQKISVIVVFALGGFVCIVSILRLALVHMYAMRDDLNHSGIAAIRWSTIEANIGIICASLMALKPLLVKLFPGLNESRPSKCNMRLPHIHEEGKDEWCWNGTCDTTCTASSRLSVIRPPMEGDGIKVTKDTLVQAAKVDSWDEADSIRRMEQALLRV